MTASGETTAGRIVEAGRQFIMRRGYAGFSYADIAEAIVIRKASIHHHFPSKTDLVVEVVKQSQAGFDAQIGALEAEGADAPAQLHAYVDYWERCIADDSAPFCVAGTLGAELPALPDEVAQAVRAHFGDITAWLERALASGEKAGTITLTSSVQTEAATFVSLIYGAMLAARAYGNSAVFKTVADNALERLLKPRKRSRSA
jgi:TetR/AcrR family transcriptional regulator, transcriptional repressor for nem operon